jgi:hypothetical protein
MNVCAVDPAFVAHDPAGGGGPVGPGLPVEAPDDAGPSQRCADDQNWPRTSRLLPILLPEAGDSWAVEAEQDLGPGVELRRFEP